jgi:acetyl-CoA acetyltransferase
MEALGIVEVGKGGPATMDGVTAFDGKFPVNPSGGLKSKGHPVGATGVAQIVELTKQIRGDLDKATVSKPPNAKNAEKSCFPRGLRARPANPESSEKPE